MKQNTFYAINFGSSTRSRRRGSIMILGTLTITALFGMLGLGFDAAYMYHLKRMAQIAADAGAKAGSIELQNGSTTDTVKTQIKAETSTNGFTDGANSVTITVNKPPVGGNWSGNANAVQVIVSQTIATSFMQVLGISNAQVVAEAVGGLQSGQGCVYALDPTANNAVVISGGTTSFQANCGVVVDSSASQAFDVSGGATFSATSVSVVGGVADTSGADKCGSNCTVTNSPNKPVTGVTPEADPLANVPEPTVGACTYSGLGTLTGGSAAPSVTPPITGNGTAGNPFVFSAGTYCDGFKISGAYATFGSGTYIIKGISGSNQSFNVSGSASNVSGSNVTFFITASSASNYRAIAISGGATVSLAAPTSGSLSGMLFFQDRTLTGVNKNDQESFTGGSNMLLSGALYFPLDNLVFSGGSSAHPDYTILVADTITFSGGSALNNDYSSLGLGSPIQVTGVIE